MMGAASASKPSFFIIRSTSSKESLKDHLLRKIKRRLISTSSMGKSETPMETMAMFQFRHP